ncbi:hypothetical protein FQA47_014509 [Oryzias melastigma]|uniref:Uncharacterized protein n=1 Tax=Oryzias melastigma TaxID=30732 RepID=A0A834F9F6_ORYME|nr:hypothetical protein FQA47_014509 [Oryzias melastigma]
MVILWSTIWFAWSSGWWYSGVRAGLRGAVDGCTLESELVCVEQWMVVLWSPSWFAWSSGWWYSGVRAGLRGAVDGDDLESGPVNLEPWMVVTSGDATER